jgi:hypothetical protein
MLAILLSNHVKDIPVRRTVRGLVSKTDPNTRLPNGPEREVSKTDPNASRPMNLASGN